MVIVLGLWGTLPSRADDSWFQGEPTRGRQLRLLSWNVKAGSLFSAEVPQPVDEEVGTRVGSFGRILRAVRPDVICLQEIWPRRDKGLVQQLLETELPLESGSVWFIHWKTDLVIASRFPLRQRQGALAVAHPQPGQPEFHYGQAMCLVDLPDERFASDLYVMTAHFKSRSGAASVALREQQADQMAAWLRDVRIPGGFVDVPSRTPIVVAGDFNVYESNEDDPRQHLATLITGDIQDEARFGSDFLPDWDESPLADLRPSVNGAGKEFYTWRNDAQRFLPGALDRVLFTDSVLRSVGGGVLNTTSLSAAQLKASGLRPTDSLFGGREGFFDHLPVVAEFEFPVAAPRP